MSQNILNNLDSPIRKSTEAISYATVSKYARLELTSGNFESFLSVSTLDIGGEHKESTRENQKIVFTEKVTQSLPFYNTNTSSAKVYDQGANR